MSITTVHHNLPKIVSKSIIKSMIGSLNATCIAYTRGHLKFGTRQLPTDRLPNIDDHNDEINAVNAEIERQRVAGTMGFAMQMPTAELIERLMTVREYFVDRIEQMKDSANDNALSIAETVKFQIERQPENKDAFIDALLNALGDDIAITKEQLVAAQLKMVTDDNTDLRNNAARIVDYLGQYAGVNDEFDDAAVENYFDELPPHVQYKLMSAAIRAHDKASQAAMIKLLRGNLDAAGDIKMIKANRDDLIKWLIAFSKKHQSDLDAYVERGGSLMEIEDRTVVTSNTNAPGPTGKMQRAPAPTA